MLKKTGYFLLAVFVIIQFFHPAKNVNAYPAAINNDITRVYPVPDDVQQVLKTSCYDCHSNNTKYPWYAAIQPVAWWLNDHVNEGKREVNFNEFAAYRPGRQYKKFDEIIKQVKEDEMPLSSYTLVHRDAKLSKLQADALMNWAASMQDSMKAKYPADSLLRKDDRGPRQ